MSSYRQGIKTAYNLDLLGRNFNRPVVKSSTALGMPRGTFKLIVTVELINVLPVATTQTRSQGFSFLCSKENKVVEKQLSLIVNLLEDYWRRVARHSSNREH